MTENEKVKAKEFYTQLLNDIKAKAPALDMLFLDESVSAYTENLIDKSSLLQFLSNRPAGLEIILTGHKPPSELLDMADYISEIKKVRHPFEKGEKARKGIEW
jgi:cob(I)alamin adenosyltransferase